MIIPKLSEVPLSPVSFPFLRPLRLSLPKGLRLTRERDEIAGGKKKEGAERERERGEDAVEIGGGGRREHQGRNSGGDGGTGRQRGTEGKRVRGRERESASEQGGERESERWRGGERRMERGRERWRERENDGERERTMERERERWRE